jgi:hypothetical protein
MEQMRKHLSTVFVKGKEVFRGSSAECNKEICRILCSHGIFHFKGSYFNQQGKKVKVDLYTGVVPSLKIERIADNKRKKHEKNL